MDLSNIKLLVVGAGGIGCELLKNLVLSGFIQIEVIDLDTIELSNLNRQFLFQKQHVGKPKAIIARESVLKYNPKANIIAHHDSIMNVKYNVEYFKQFNLVLNALDNKAARSHVNRLCLAADVPLIESGSAGYLGQVTLIKKSLTECYDCLPKPPAKTFPGCTIRNTPSEPIHCIVWAKHLFNQLFGAEDPDEAVSPDGEDPENMAEAGQTAAAKGSNEEIVTRISTRQWAKETKYESTKIFNKLFNDDVKYLLSMAKLWEKRRAPSPLVWNESIENETVYVDERQTSKSSSSSDDPNKLASHKIWSISQCCKVFSESVQALHKRLEEAAVSCSDNPILCWDKDDEDALNFVASASSLRCYIFSIPVRSKFEIKSLAGNIIPAIATTNAIVAGLIVLQAMKVLNSKLEECRTVYLRDKPAQGKLIVATQLVKPNEKCYVCAAKPEINVRLNLNTFTVKNFESKILKQELNMVQPDVEIDDGTGRIIISSEEGETDENNDKTLAFFGLTDQSCLKCDDFFQNYELKIILYQCDKFESENTKEYEIIADNQALKDLQEQMKKNQQDDQQQPTTSAAAAEAELKDAGLGVTKRRYDTAFDEDDESVSTNEKNQKRKSFKKLKSSSNENLNEINSDTNNAVDDSSSNSIDDASDAISDEDLPLNGGDNDNLAVVQSKEINSTTTRNKCDDILVDDDDCIIEESSNDVRLANGDFIENTTTTATNDAHSYDNNNQDEDEEDDDIIECTSDEGDIIEINDDDDDDNQSNTNDNKNLPDNNYQNGNQHNTNGNGNVLNGNNHLNGNGNNEYKNGSDNNIVINKKKLVDQENDDSCTVIE